MITLFFGSPGCGKTTLAQYLMLRDSSDYRFSNFDTTLADKIDSSLIGKFAFPDYSTLYIDEAGIDFNNRKYKTLSQDTIEYFKLHRHFKNDIVLFSQSWEDTDVTLRRLVSEVWYLRRLGPFTVARKLRKFVQINKDTNQIEDGYRAAGLMWSLLPPPLHEKTIFIIFRPFYYKYFDSYYRPDKFIPLRSGFSKRYRQNLTYRLRHPIRFFKEFRNAH